MAWGQKRALGVPGGPATGGIAKAGRVLPHPGLLGDRWGYPKLFPPALHTLAGTFLTGLITKSENKQEGQWICEHL
jgi:hypothetical protein